MTAKQIRLWLVYCGIERAANVSTSRSVSCGHPVITAALLSACSIRCGRVFVSGTPSYELNRDTAEDWRTQTRWWCWAQGTRFVYLLYSLCDAAVVLQLHPVICVCRTFDPRWVNTLIILLGIILIFMLNLAAGPQQINFSQSWNTMVSSQLINFSPPSRWQCGRSFFGPHSWNSQTLHKNPSQCIQSSFTDFSQCVTEWF